MDSLAAVCDRVAAWSSRNRKVELLAGYLRPLSDRDLERAVSFLCGRPILRDHSARLAVGYATLREALEQTVEWDLEIIRLCLRQVGDGGEAIGLLLQNGKPGTEPLSLELAEEIYVRLLLGNRFQRVTLLAGVFQRHRPLSVKYFVKCIGGDFRIGLQAKMVEEAVAAALDSDVDALRAANNKLGNLAGVALAARRGEMDRIEARLFHPLDFMLAKPIEAIANVADAADWLVEDKYDGIRAQVHRSGGRVRIFTRGMEDATAAFPEIVAAMERLDTTVVLDGEVLGWRDGRALPFALLQQRIARKKVSTALREEIPVVFLGYDVMYHGDRLVLDQPIEERRALLEGMLGGAGEPLLVSPQWGIASHEEIGRLFEQARERGNEGLVLKRRGSLYEPGKRTGVWCKVKRPFGTLDVVVTAAEQGHGKRATMLSDYTFGVWSDGVLVNVGKAYSGLTDEEIRELTRLFRSIATERFGRVLLVQPRVVLEVAFDGVQKSQRHKGGFALRFPRIVRWRQDKRPEEADSIAVVEALYEKSLR